MKEEAMMGIRSIFAAIIVCFALAFTASPASAQASRTWVSGVGDDVNPCSRTAPCKTFAGAISKTAAGGEINCLDPGGFGAFTANKSITIDCTGTLGGILASSTTGVLINTAGVRVVLRGITINGGPPTITGIHGVRFLQGEALYMEDVIIQNFNSASAGAGNGVTFAPTTAAELQMSNVTVVNNGGSSSAAGVLIAPTGAGTAAATLDHVRLVNNTGSGVLISGASTVMIANSRVTQNTSFGIRTSAGAPTVRVATTVITGNGTGVSVGAGTIESYCNNRLNGNAGDGAFFGPCVAEK
jgi:Right handed beta helix region